ncbi:3-oxoacid CoA-transferase subunit B [Campylobacter upsaliensis]|uniref:Succinyl-CoA:3-ketoacid coenzyme A transferase subunit B n=1 Tax=Campylobacter upsaliensis JV21 TaxID=888826 RepID=A0A828QXX2_CAMUP|nr:3-oxoacid CoA-transferase subunit B [Campylobacter upsaliensis]EAI8053568.1 3-oxoacid CoA-transferase subunit B [Campylobacter upsaliensis]EAK3536833.1 3-oxoacid CoA-transferase subunit B [Campylobacter upsaliensis]EAL3923107.1 3-oxoacid CoA-transferase subunit B [Campylobacter upsaliensis]EAV9673734.1 3-oxoacid CoA-transferase subunit B [Campylobacter upsaliensis]EDP6869329.1 3-oxoacid CoA-transferase subunit B [Campylobacter upsaliensis]
MSKELIIKRAVKEIQNGMYINLGIGIPTLIADEIEKLNLKVFLQSENGLLGIGAYPTKEQVDADLINAGKETVTAVKGASFFDSAESFAMIRGGHIDLAILGGMEVSQNGDLANYMIPGKLVKGMGGAMDLVSGAKKIIVVMEHTNKHGETKLKKECTLPLTGKAVVHKLITELGVFEFEGGEMFLVELMQGVGLEDIKAKTEAEFKVRLGGA